MNENARKARVRDIERIAERLSDEGLENLLAAAEDECTNDPDCQGSGDPGSGEPPPDPPPNP